MSAISSQFIRHSKGKLLSPSGSTRTTTSERVETNGRAPDPPIRDRLTGQSGVPDSHPDRCYERTSPQNPGRPDPTPMRRSQLCADRDSGCTIPPTRTTLQARQLLRIVFGAMSIRVARCRRLLISCAPRGPISSRDCSSTWNSRKAPQMLALLRSRSQSSAPQDRRLLSRAATGHGDRLVGQDYFLTLSAIH